MPRTGRPRRSAGTPTQVPLTLTTEELAEIDAAAEAAGMSRSAYLRDTALERARGGLVLTASIAEVLHEQARARRMDPQQLAAIWIGVALGQARPPR